MNEVKKKGIGKAKVSLLILTVLAVVLTISNLWVYTSLQRQINTLGKDKKNLNIQMSTLQTEKSNLNNDINNLQSKITSLEAENDNIESEIDNLQSEKYNLQREIDWLKQIAEEDNFQFYYASLAKQRYDVDDLEEYLDRWQWIEGTYTKGVFDCGEMSAYIEWKLENEGYHTIIVVGDSPSGGDYHAWLLVETSEGKYMPVEATQYDLVKWSSPYFDNYFVYDRTFETIQEALDYSYYEFDWWN